MNHLLHLEINKYNSVLKTISRSLSELSKSISGFVMATEESE